jgi:ketosteroid isomerase-like protein
MTVEDNKAVVRSFFEEALDKGNMGLVDDIFTEDCVFHRGDLTEPAQGYTRGTFDCRKACSTLPRLPNDNSSDDRGKRLSRHPRDSQRNPPGPVPHTDRHV